MFEFAIFPDDTRQPAAIFVELQDAIDWGVQRYGLNRFSIRHCPTFVAEAGAPTGARSIGRS